MRISAPVIIVIASVFGGCNACQTSRSGEDVVTVEPDELARTIEQIGKEVESLSVPDELFVSKAFMAVYEHPEAYAAAAIALMGRREISTHQKRIIAYSMQGLSLDHFLALIYSAIDSVEIGVTDMRVLETVAFSPLNWGRQLLVMRYQNPQVRAVLARLMAMKQLPERRRTYIQQKILTGQAKLDYLDYMDTLGKPVREEE